MRTYNVTITRKDGSETQTQIRCEDWKEARTLSREAAREAGGKVKLCKRSPDEFPKPNVPKDAGERIRRMLNS